MEQKLPTKGKDLEINHGLDIEEAFEGSAEYKEVMGVVSEQGFAGLFNLANEIQSWLRDHSNPGGTEVASRSFLLLDKTPLSRKFYREKYDVWLGPKGFEAGFADGASSHEDIGVDNLYYHTTREESSKVYDGVAGLEKNELMALLNQLILGLQLTAKKVDIYTGHLKLRGENPLDENNTQVIELVANTFRLIREELLADGTENTVNLERYEELLQEPLASQGISLKRKNS